MRYLIESPHTPEECLQHQDEVLARGPEDLAVYDWGCMAGDHTAWAVIEVSDRVTAEDRIPPFLRHKARVVELNKFTPEHV
ncbi:MAG: hypothetical protein ACRDJ9_00895, partial [Dehalococcoidia bacterium]